MASSHEVLTDTQQSRMEINSHHDESQSESIPAQDSTMSPKQSWQEIKEAVGMSRKIHAHFANKIPHDFKFVKIDPAMYPDRTMLYPRDVENYSTRIFFLGALAGHRENQLLYVDVPKKPDASIIDKAIEWRPVVAMFPRSLQPIYSKEEELLRERKRVGVHGVTSYSLSEDRNRLFFPAGGEMYYADLKNLGRLNASVPKYITFKRRTVRIDPTLCPHNNELVAYVEDNDLWVKNIVSGDEKRLTYAHKGLKDAIKDPKGAGIASYVLQEEFDRYTAHWWQPNTPKGFYRLLYEEVDESNVEILHIANPLVQPDVDSYRYPRAGTANTTVTLKIVEFSTNADGMFSEPVIKNLRQPLESLFPWMEYIVRVNWVPSGSGVWMQILDRPQERSAVVYIPASFFDKVQSPEDKTNGETKDVPLVDDNQDVEMEVQCCSKSLPQQSALTDDRVLVLVEEKSEVWINVHDTYYFYKNNVEGELNFIWSSERTGYRHLYHINCQLNNVKVDVSNPESESVNNTVSRCITTETALTSGEWVVLDHAESVWVNENTKQIFFMGLKDTPLETHLYMVNRADPSNPTRVTQAGRSHTVNMNEDCDMFVTVSSSMNELYSAQLYQLSEQQQRPVMTMNLLEAIDLTQDYKPPEMFSFKNSSGDTLHGMIHLPLDLQTNKKYPTVLYVYGGPRVQLVTNSFKGLRYQRLYTLAALGYAVVTVDGRGSTHRGIQFEGYIKGKLGQVEIEDQVEGLKYAAEKYECIDLSRVAIHGWSYGGYLSLVGIMQRPDVFKISIAGAPVSSWFKYDTGYTERYMGTPESNPDGYNKGSLLKTAYKFPDEPNRLFLVHGVIDENVHFVHAAHLINALVKYCKPYQLQIYPGERHGIRSPESNEHFEVVVISYFQQYL